MNIDSLIAELGICAGLPALRLDADRTCRLVFDETVAVDLEVHPEEEALLLHTVVGQVPAEERQAFYLRLLSANHASEAEGTLAVIPDTREVVLWKNIPVPGCKATELATMLTDTVTHARRVAAWLRAPQEETPLHIHSSEPEPASGDMIRV